MNNKHNTLKINGKKLKLALRGSGMTQTEAAIILKVTRQTVGNWVNKEELDEEILQNVKAKLGIDLTGEGESPIKPNEYNPSSYGQSEDLSTYRGAQSESEYYYDKKPKTIPYFDIEATAGHINVFNDEAETPAYQISIPAFSDCDFALNVAGNSMYPKFMSGDIIICKQLSNMNVIPLGEVYLIVTDEQRLVKYIRKSQKEDCFLLVSENPNYEAWDICKEDIKKIYLVKGKIQRNQI